MNPASLMIITLIVVAALLPAFESTCVSHWTNSYGAECHTGDHPSQKCCKGCSCTATQGTSLQEPIVWRCIPDSGNSCPDPDSLTELAKGSVKDAAGKVLQLGGHVTGKILDLSGHVGEKALKLGGRALRFLGVQDDDRLPTYHGEDD